MADHQGRLRINHQGRLRVIKVDRRWELVVLRHVEGIRKMTELRCDVCGKVVDTLLVDERNPVTGPMGCCEDCDGLAPAAKQGMAILNGLMKASGERRSPSP